MGDLRHGQVRICGQECEKLRFSQESHPRLANTRDCQPDRPGGSAPGLEKYDSWSINYADRLSKLYDDCLASVQKRQRMDSLMETARSLETEAAELLAALTEHRKIKPRG